MHQYFSVYQNGQSPFNSTVSIQSKLLSNHWNQIAPVESQSLRIQFNQFDFFHFIGRICVGIDSISLLRCKINERLWHHIFYIDLYCWSHMCLFYYALEADRHSKIYRKLWEVHWKKWVNAVKSLNLIKWLNWFCYCNRGKQSECISRIECKNWKIQWMVLPGDDGNNAGLYVVSSLLYRCCALHFGFGHELILFISTNWVRFIWNRREIEPSNY